ncbi:phosphatidylinositol-specific phospholipase C domain-containing protein [Pseudomonas sp. NPDC087346]|uniref:phosphatidylinositol-specific phospholipase C domain-containing protein n=1 Tax=Pseudomonas sp. NPDC087346 TaxID=3364438 RepID=UPI0037FC9B03
MNSTTSTGFSLNNWMAGTPAIDKLSLYKLALPGTHNAGCDWQASYALIPGAHWVACQHKAFYEQLNSGSRALDLRLVYKNNGEGLAKFRIQHNGFLSSRTLGNLVSDIERFLTENPEEFIILDFHELKEESHPFDYVTFNNMLLKSLNNRVIPSSNRHLSLAQLKNISRSQRILIHAGWHRELDNVWFNDKVQHQWIGTQTPGASDIQKFIAEVMVSPPSSYQPWSLSATCYAALGGPVDIHTHLDRWFDPANSDWLLKCNIVNVDFIE